MYLNEKVTIRYLLNAKIPTAMAFVPPEGEVIAFVRPRDHGYVKLVHSNVREPVYDAASTWGPEDAPDASTGRLVSTLRDLMAANGVAGQPLGVDNLDLRAIQALTDAGFRLTYAQPLLEYARAIKTVDEIAIYRTMGQQYTHAVNAFRNAIRPGITENELAAVVVGAWYEAGGEQMAQLNVCAGENMNPWRRWPTQRKLRDGELVGLDLHGYGINGLRGDASRTFLVGDGSPSSDQLDLYQRAYDYLKVTIDQFRAGRSYSEVMQSVPDVESVYKVQLHHYDIAHSIGMVPQGYPEVDPRNPPLDDVLYPNQALSVECYFGEEGGEIAVKLEEQIIVRNGSPEIIGPDIPYDERMLS
jgi:Xaa-Pro aminopeptidase